MTNFKSFNISDDETVAYLQPGLAFTDVYAEINPRNLTVPGGRVNGACFLYASASWLISMLLCS
jgi:hypothetical protein